MMTSVFELGRVLVAADAHAVLPGHGEHVSAAEMVDLADEVAGPWEMDAAAGRAVAHPRDRPTPGVDSVPDLDRLAGLVHELLRWLPDPEPESRAERMMVV